MDNEESQHGGEVHPLPHLYYYKVKPACMVPIRPQLAVGAVPPQHALQPNEVFAVTAVAKDRHENFFMQLADEPGWIGPLEEHTI